MIYECDQCSKALPPGVMACPSCGETFEDVVPLDAEVPRRGFSAVQPDQTIVLGNPVIKKEVTLPAPEARTKLRPLAASAAEETLFYQDSIVTVTNTRIVIRDKTYAAANVTSVSMTVIGPQVAGGCAGALFGAIVLAAGIAASSNGAIVVGLVVLVAAIIIACLKKAKYMMRIVSASAESNALWAYDAAYIQKIVNAINEAIIRRG